MGTAGPGVLVWDSRPRTHWTKTLLNAERHDPQGGRDPQGCAHQTTWHPPPRSDAAGEARGDGDARARTDFGEAPRHETGRCANASKETRGRRPGHRPWDTPFSQAPTAATETDTHGGHQTGKAKDPGHAFGW